MSLPILIDTVSAAAIQANESFILDVANGLISQCGEEAPDLTEPIQDHLNAVTLANELMFAHEAPNIADQTLFQAARQLKLYHLYQLNELISA
jgi:hypothetical protein